MQSREMPVNSNWTTAAQYRQIAEWINGHHDGGQLAVAGELGTIQYFTEAHATNEFSNRQWLSQHILTLDQTLWLDRLMALNFRHMEIDELEPPQLGLMQCKETEQAVKKWTVDGRWQNPVTYCLLRAKL